MYYIRETNETIQPPFMSDSAYQEARQSLPFIATDAVIFDADKRYSILPGVRRHLHVVGGWLAVA